jgi:hypothetical protein
LLRQARAFPLVLQAFSDLHLRRVLICSIQRHHRRR